MQWALRSNIDQRGTFLLVFIFLVLVCVFRVFFRYETFVDVNNIVNVIGKFDENGRCRVSNNENFIVVEPDLLLSGTSIVSSVYCPRRSSLNLFVVCHFNLFI